MTRALSEKLDILNRAADLLSGDREEDYGDAARNHQCIAALITAYLANRQGDALTPTDAAIVLCLVKIARIAVNSAKLDNYTDLAAYAAIAGECRHYG